MKVNPVKAGLARFAREWPWMAGCLQEKGAGGTPALPGDAVRLRVGGISGGRLLKNLTGILRRIIFNASCRDRISQTCVRGTPVFPSENLDPPTIQKPVEPRRSRRYTISPGHNWGMPPGDAALAAFRH